MNRLRARCFIASAAGHGLLALLLLTGSGFLRARRAPEPLPILTFVPDRLVDAMVVGGGSPLGSLVPAPRVPMPLPAPPLAGRATAPAPAPPKPPAAAKPPKTAPEREPSRLDLKEPKPGRRSRPTAKSGLAGGEAGDRNKSSQKHEVEANLKPTVRQPAGPAQEQAQTQAELAALAGRAAAEAGGRNKSSQKHEVEANLKPTVRQPAGPAQEQAQTQAELAALAGRAAAAQRARVTGAVTTLESKLAGGSLSAVPFGPGGETYANYGLFVLSVYDWAWQPPEEVSDESATVKVKLVIARAGKVISSEILAKSGWAALDKSVREALGRVNDIGKPFPEGAKEDQRVIIINFNLKARHRLG